MEGGIEKEMEKLRKEIKEVRKEMQSICNPVEIKEGVSGDNQFNLIFYNNELLELHNKLSELETIQAEMLQQIVYDKYINPVMEKINKCNLKIEANDLQQGLD